VRYPAAVPRKEGAPCLSRNSRRGGGRNFEGFVGLLFRKRSRDLPRWLSIHPSSFADPA
jgi:hypothetical protein